MLTVGSLFSGIGGIDLGLERTGYFRTIWFSEIDKYANRVLAKHWPDVPNLGNVKEINFEHIERPDVLVGGYPCQPFSIAGSRQGEQDPRHLWPECLRALRVLRPRYALFENVRGHLSLGFSRVLSDLASIGYDAEWQVIPAAAVGAPHKRDRIFIVAYPSFIGGDVERHGDGVESDREQRIQKPVRGSGGDMANDERQWDGQHWQPTNPRQERQGGHHHRNGETSDVKRPRWAAEPDVGRVAHGIPARVDRLRALGNAVVPQVAEAIGYLIAEDANARA